jgi:hypothetical protein
MLTAPQYSASATTRRKTFIGLHGLGCFSFFQAKRQVAIPDVDLPGILALDQLLDQHQ